MELEDLIIPLKEDQGYLGTGRVIGVDLSGRVNFSTYSFGENFGYDSGAIGSVYVDPSYPSTLLVNIKDEPVLETPDENVNIRYSALGTNGDMVTGRIILDNLDFEISAAPIDVQLDICCDLPTDLEIDVTKHNGGIPVELTNVGAGNIDAGTITVLENNGSDYNEDYNGDYGGTPTRKVGYALNTSSDFWKKRPAIDSFSYTISYKGKTASNLITVRNTNP